MSSVLDAAEAARRMMKDIGINGSFDVRWRGSRSTGWVGKPGGDDFEVTVVIKPLPPISENKC